jgi:hypothetical protein
MRRQRGNTVRRRQYCAHVKAQYARMKTRSSEPSCCRGFAALIFKPERRQAVSAARERGGSAALPLAVAQHYAHMSVAYRLILAAAAPAFYALCHAAAMPQFTSHARRPLSIKWQWAPAWKVSASQSLRLFVDAHERSSLPTSEV